MSKASDAALLNTVVNTSEVLMNVAPGYAELDVSQHLEKPENFIVGSRKGLVLFNKLDQGYYEIHYLLTSQLRGRERFQLIRDAIWQLFTYRDCYAIVGPTPRENRAARAMNRALGGTPIGAKVDNLGRACIIYKLERKTWLLLSGLQ